MIAKNLSTIANANNHIALTDGAGLCCGDQDRHDYTTAELDITGTTVEDVGVQIPGGSVVSTDLDGDPIDWTDTANDNALIEALGKVATDLGYEWFGGGIELNRGAADTDLTIVVRDSTLIFAWIGTDTTDENAFTEVDVVP